MKMYISNNGVAFVSASSVSYFGFVTVAYSP